MINQLKEYDRAYYECGKSFVTDEYYDSLKDVARKKYPNDPYFKDVGSEVTRDKVKLPYILGSLNKVKIDTVDKWISEHRGQYVISQKMDGVSILVIYENGYVKHAYTRGNGEYGRDITDKALLFCPKIENDSVMILRGEAVIAGYEVHDKLGFSTARNGVAGILNRDDNDLCKYVTPYFYELIQFGNLTTCSEYERFVLIESIGLNTPKWKLLEEFDVEKVLELAVIGDVYDTDGVVIALNESERENVKYPEKKVAFKIQGKPVQTKVINIEWNVTRSGRVVPVVIVEPVIVGGVTINRATGFNAEYIAENMINIGSEIELVRANDVIPYISRNISTPKYAQYQVPKKCPSCGRDLEWKGVDVVCKNRFGCGDRVLKEVEYFLRTLGAENITVKTLEKIGVWSIEDAYEIDETDILNIEGFGSKSASIVVSEIQNTLNTTPEKLLQAFGIPGVGKEIAKSLLRCFGSIENILDSDEDTLKQCEGVGPKIAENITRESSLCYDIYKYLLSMGLTLFNDKEENKKMLEGKQFALTGKGLLTREQISFFIESAGGIVKGMNKNTNYLVTSDMSSQSGKMKKAEEYGVQVISYEDLMEMLKEGGVLSAFM